MKLTSLHLTLLKPFDPELWKQGHPVMWLNLDEPLELLGEYKGKWLYLDPNTGITALTPGGVRMKPLAWVEDRPVYPGDTLFGGEDQKYEATLDCLKPLTDWYISHSWDEIPDNLSLLSWQPRALAIVEDKPVYRDSKVYYNRNADPMLIGKLVSDPRRTKPEHMTWTPLVKKTGWIAIAPCGLDDASIVAYTSHVVSDEGIAKAAMLDCEETQQITWYEPATQE